MPRPIHFEIHADDPARAIAFCEKLLGWSFHKFEGGPMPYWLITTGPDGTPGINGGLHPRMGPKPVPEQAVIGTYARSMSTTSTPTLPAPLRPGRTSACPECRYPGSAGSPM